VYRSGLNECRQVVGLLKLPAVNYISRTGMENDAVTWPRLGTFVMVRYPKLQILYNMCVYL
jgi:hypothetical protein